MIGHSNPAMTRHYDHAEHEADKIAAVASLPSMTGEQVKSLPPAPSPRLVDADAILAIVEGMNSKNWKTSKDQLLKIIGGVK